MFKYAILLAGLTQLGIAATSVLIPRLLGWREQLQRVEALTRQVFWTYSGYILGIHLWFAALALGLGERLVDGTPLAAVVTGFIAVYWGVRVVAQFTWYDRGVGGRRLLFRVAEVLYVTAFLFVTAVFAAATAHNLGVGR
ncbi:MAG TPA: hypothetical protein VGR02_09360 [Thermoanaerobaculia bacterium]|jgi:hypothetical protein|nr:hypothetical protein [Thermoanaerobaculia bacterium]